jgi:hypothetical protein
VIPRVSRKSAGRDDADTGDRLARIERMIEHYRLAKDRRLERRAVTLWRKLETQQAFIEFEKPPERVH